MKMEGGDKQGYGSGRVRWKDGGKRGIGVGEMEKEKSGM